MRRIGAFGLAGVLAVGGMPQYSNVSSNQISEENQPVREVQTQNVQYDFKFPKKKDKEPIGETYCEPRTSGSRILTLPLDRDGDLWLWPQFFTPILPIEEYMGSSPERNVEYQ